MKQYWRQSAPRQGWYPCTCHVTGDGDVVVIAVPIFDGANCIYLSTTMLKMTHLFPTKMTSSLFKRGSSPVLVRYGNERTTTRPQVLFVLRRTNRAFNGRTIRRPRQPVCLQVSSPEPPNPWGQKIRVHTRLTSEYNSFLYKSCPRPEHCSLVWVYKKRIC